MHIILNYYLSTDDNVYYTIVYPVIICTYEKSAIYDHEFIFIRFVFFFLIKNSIIMALIVPKI